MQTILKFKNIVFLITASFFLVSFPLSAMAFEKEVNNLSQRMSEKIVQAGKKRVAVVDFTDLGGRTTELGRFLAEEFSVAIAGSGKGFEVVDRTHLKSIIKEHKLSATGLIDPSTARKLGKIAGVEALVTGTLTPFGDSVRLSVKVLDTETAKVIAAERGNIAKTQAIAYLLSQEVGASQGEYSQPPASSGYVQPRNGSKSKKVGNVTITVNRIQVLRGEIMVALDFFNHLKNTLLLVSNYQYPDLSDDHGNVFKYSSGMSSANSVRSSWQVLNPMSNNDVILRFKLPEDISIKDIGRSFSLTCIYRLYDTKKRDGEHNYQVSFMNLPAYKPK